MGEVRLIAGTLRGRRLRFPDIPDVRPTPDRVRETLFNWLAPIIEGAHCLDLFAGSGALGFEAASRGAARVVMVERDRQLVHYLTQQATTLKAAQVEVHLASAEAYLMRRAEPFDVVFLDPPYTAHALFESCCERLENGGWLAEHAWLYLETAADERTFSFPPAWSPHREQRAGRVGYRLYARHGP